MRLSPEQRQTIAALVREELGADVDVRLFGSRTHPNRRGGDIDLLVSLPHPVAHPARLASRLEARIIRALEGRSVDVLLAAPNLERQPIHAIAETTGIPL